MPSAYEVDHARLEFMLMEEGRMPQALKMPCVWERGVVAAIAFALAVVMCSLLAPSPFAAAQDGGGGEDNLAPGWGIHAALMTLATIFFVASYVALWLKILTKLEVGVVPAIATRVSRLWYKLHMYLGALGVIFALAGVLWGYLIVQWAYGGPHLRLMHSYVGYLTAGIALAPLLTGFLARTIKKGRVTVRWWHVALGLVGIVMMVVGTYSGWALE